VKIVEAQLATPEGATDMLLYEKYDRLKRQLSDAEAEWEKAMAEMEEGA
jgi:ATP-binding cassette subfamily F protein 3